MKDLLKQALAKMLETRDPVLLNSKDLRMARGLGILSLGLGLAEVMMPEKISKSLGMKNSQKIVHAYGAREITNGVAILTADDPTPAVWARVGGDILDMATLTAGLNKKNAQRKNVGIAMAVVAGALALDLFCASRLSMQKGSFQELATLPKNLNKKAHHLEKKAAKGFGKLQSRFLPNSHSSNLFH